MFRFSKPLLAFVFFSLGFFAVASFSVNAADPACTTCDAVNHEYACWDYGGRAMCCTAHGCPSHACNRLFDPVSHEALGYDSQCEYVGSSCVRRTSCSSIPLDKCAEADKGCFVSGSTCANIPCGFLTEYTCESASSCAWNGRCRLIGGGDPTLCTTNYTKASCDSVGTGVCRWEGGCYNTKDCSLKLNSVIISGEVIPDTCSYCDAPSCGVPSAASLVSPLGSTFVTPSSVTFQWGNPASWGGCSSADFIVNLWKPAGTLITSYTALSGVTIPQPTYASTYTPASSSTLQCNLGTYTWSVSTRTAGGVTESAPSTFTVVNNTPTVTISSNKSVASVGETVIVTVNAADINSNLSVIELHAYYESDGTSSQIGSQTCTSLGACSLTFSYTIPAGKTGTLVFTGLVRDTCTAAQVTTSVSIQDVCTINTAPNVSISTNKTTAFVGETVAVTATATDTNSNLSVIELHALYESDGSSSQISSQTCTGLSSCTLNYNYTIPAGKTGTLRFTALARDTCTAAQIATNVIIQETYSLTINVKEKTGDCVNYASFPNLGKAVDVSVYGASGALATGTIGSGSSSITFNNISRTSANPSCAAGQQAVVLSVASTTCGETFNISCLDGTTNTTGCFTPSAGNGSSKSITVGMSKLAADGWFTVKEGMINAGTLNNSTCDTNLSSYARTEVPPVLINNENGGSSAPGFTAFLKDAFTPIDSITIDWNTQGSKYESTKKYATFGGRDNNLSKWYTNYGTALKIPTGAPLLSGTSTIPLRITRGNVYRITGVNFQSYLNAITNTASPYTYIAGPVDILTSVIYVNGTAGATLTIPKPLMFHFTAELPPPIIITNMDISFASSLAGYNCYVPFEGTEYECRDPYGAAVWTSASATIPSVSLNIITLGKITSETPSGSATYFPLVGVGPLVAQSINLKKTDSTINSYYPGEYFEYNPRLLYSVRRIDDECMTNSSKICSGLTETDTQWIYD